MATVDLHDERLTAFGLLHEVYSALRRRFEPTLNRHGLSAPEYEVLLRVGRSEGQRLRITELARQVAVTTGGATRLVDRLVEAGLVERRPCLNDRRVQFVVLTPAGIDRLTDATAEHVVDVQAALVDPLSPEDVRDLMDTLDRVRAQLEEVAPVR